MAEMHFSHSQVVFVDLSTNFGSFVGRHPCWEEMAFLLCPKENMEAFKKGGQLTQNIEQDRRPVVQWHITGCLHGEQSIKGMVARRIFWLSVLSVTTDTD